MMLIDRVFTLTALLVVAGGPPARSLTDLGRHDAWAETRVGATVIRSQRRPVPPQALEALGRLNRVYRDHFETEPKQLVIYLVMDKAHPGYEYDSFDHARNEIWMRWRLDNVDYAIWTLAHELAHAYQFAFAPRAYRQDPSWIHEGWAEYAAGLYYRDRGPQADRAFKIEQIRQYRASRAKWSDIFNDVYQFGWRKAYPSCYLAVCVLVEDHGDLARLKRYFRTHGQGGAHDALRNIYGIGVADLKREIRDYANMNAQGE